MSVLALLLAVAIGMLLAPAPPARDAKLDEVLRRTSSYVAEYRKQLVGIVAEELYRQNVENVTRGGRRLRQFRELRSDLLLVKLPAEDAWLQFRDVFEVDRKPVRDRDERLIKLFVNATAADAQKQAETIQTESARYNIGPITRTVNMPILGLLFFDTENVKGMQVELLEARNTGRFSELADPASVVRLGYREVATPTLIRGSGGKDMRSHGEVWVDASNGRILRTQIICEDGTIAANITVSYRSEPGIPVLVPAEMREIYRLRVAESRIDGRATYSRFRQFTVTTTEKPKPQ